MAKGTIHRRLAGILFADVVGYSGLMEADEAGTLAKLRKCRKSVLEPQINRHHGRIIKLMGDGTLTEFGSVVDAINCAVEIQQRMAKQNTELPEKERLELRIGVNLGDVVVEGQDIYGDGVNVAVRLEQLAEPGGILISGLAYDQLEKKLALGFEFIGNRHVKNIERPIRVYRVRMGASRSPRTISTRILQKEWVRPVGVALLVLIAVASAIPWLRNIPPQVEPASIQRMAYPLPEKPSIAVLPFTNMSSDPQQEHFADGITDDIITDLSKISGLFVIARTSTFTYKGKPITIPHVAEELGIRYVLEGSVQRAGDQLRVNAQLIDALTGGHVWAERFEGDVANVFIVQDEFVSKIVGALKISLTKSEKQQIAGSNTENIQAREAFEEGWNHYLRFTAENNRAAVEPLKKAIQLDPYYGRAYAALAFVYHRAAEYGWLQDIGIEELTEQDKIAPLLEMAKKYSVALAYAGEAQTHLYHGRSEDALRLASQAIALEPNDPEAHIVMAWALIIAGRPMEALNFAATAMRLNPNYPAHYVLARAIAHFAAGELSQAAIILEDGVRVNPQADVLLPPLASVLALLGRRDEAEQKLRSWQQKTGKVGSRVFAHGYTFPFRWEPRYGGVRERLMDGLKLAALPLEITISSLISQLNDQNNPFGRQVAAEQLGWFGPSAAAAVPALINSLDDEAVRQQAAQALGKIGPKAVAAIPALTKLQNESLMRFYAQQALQEIRGY
jgi:TolB-like protein/class 3 adenylate cyclase/Flp pilus assembly protein TadD